MILPVLGVPVAAKLEHSRERVAADVILAKDLGKPAFTVAPPHLELPHPVLRHHKALGEEEVARVLRVDMRHAELVANHFDRLARARDNNGPIQRCERRLRCGYGVGRRSGLR